MPCAANKRSKEGLAEYYYGADDQVVSRKMFGFQGRKDQGYLGNLRDRGHELFYHYDAMGNVNDLTDHLGSVVLKYRYDAFGGVFTQLWNPYNQVGLTGKSYDIKASLMDYSARWYSPVTGRFTSQDTWTGSPFVPQTQNRYAYALNNPINITDPTGHIPCDSSDTGENYCEYIPRDDWSNSGDTGGGGSDYYPVPDPWDHWEPLPDVPPPPTLEQLLTWAIDAFSAASDEQAAEIQSFVQGVGNYGQGFTCGFFKNASFNYLQDFCQDDLKADSKSYLWGKVTADTVSMLGGGALAVGGTAGDVVLTATGVGVIATPAATAAAIGGGSVAVTSWYNLEKDSGLLFSKNSSISKESPSKGTYSRPSGYRKGVKDQVWENSKGPDGEVKDPVTGETMSKDEPWDMGHKPGFEFRKHQKSADERDISRKQFLDEYNNADHYRPELPSSNRSHKGEDLSDDYFGP